nr:hypothetical protein [Tanacetum cinerariifolium]
MMGDVSEQKVPMSKLMITLALNQEKSPDILSHQGLKAFQPSAKCPMMIHGKNTHVLDIDQHHYNAKSDLIEYLHTHDSSIIISSKIDSLLDEFTRELTLLKSIPPRIDETDCDFEEEIRLIDRLFMGIEINKKEKLQQLEQVANLSTYPSKRFNSFCYDDNDDNDYNFAITPNKPDNSLSMGDEHPDTILETKSDEFIKSSVENLVLIPSESEGESEYVPEKIFSNPLFEEEITPMKIDQHHYNANESEGESVCDVPAREEFTTFSNVLFDVDYEFDSSDDQSFSDEDVPEKIFSNPLFEEEIIPMKIDQHHDNAESDLVESLCTHNSSLIISSKIDSLLDEFTDELALLKSIPPGIDETDCDFKEEIHLIEILLYDNSSPRPPKEFVSVNSDTETESFSPYPIPVEDSDSLMEEIDLSFTLDYPMPPGIVDDYYDSKRDILILKNLPSNDTLSLPEKESFHFEIPSFSRPPSKPPDGNTGILNVKMMGDISDQIVHMPKLMLTLVSNQEKSPYLSSHQGLKTFQLSDKCLMMIHGKNTPILDVPFFHFYPP